MAKPWFWDVISLSVGDQVLDRMILPAVTVVHFKGAHAHGLCQYLASQADPKETVSGIHYLLDRLGGLPGMAEGVTRTIGDHESIWVPRLHFLIGGVSGEDLYMTTS